MIREFQPRWRPVISPHGIPALAGNLPTVPNTFHIKAPSSTFNVQGSRPRSFAHPLRLSLPRLSLAVCIMLLPFALLADPDYARFFGKPVVGKNADGHIEIFKVDADGELRHRWQKLSNGSWSAWSGLGGSVFPGIAIATNAQGELQVFAVQRSNNSLGLIRQTSPGGLDWSGWINLGGALHPPIALSQDAHARIDLFAVAAQSTRLRHLWQTDTNGTWSAWTDRGGNLTPEVIAARNRDGRLERRGEDVIFHVAGRLPVQREQGIPTAYLRRNLAG